jgi:DNA-binding Lrp family transcriptional regulator
MARAFVLLNTELGAESEVMKDMKMVVEIKEAHLVYGVYDIIARIEADTMEDLKNIISWKVRRLNRVRSTLTMLTV